MRRQTRHSAFTLVELLVVIFIIALLISILMPSVRGAILITAKAKSQARLTELADGAERYKVDTGYYPGQQPTLEPISIEDPPPKGGYTGGQVLAACLFPGGQPKYASLVTNDLFYYLPPEVPPPGYANGQPSISDRFSSKPMPILYYPSRIGNKGMSIVALSPNDEYQPSDNTACLVNGTNFNGWPTPVAPYASLPPFTNFIKDIRFDGSGATPIKSGQFLMIGADRKRMYGTTDGIKNW